MNKYHENTESNYTKRDFWFLLFYIIFIVVLAGFIELSIAQTKQSGIYLKWDPNPEQDSVKSYIVYYYGDSAEYKKLAVTSDTFYNISELIANGYRTVAVAAVNNYNIESELTEIVADFIPRRPVILKINGNTVSTKDTVIISDSTMSITILQDLRDVADSTKYISPDSLEWEFYFDDPPDWGSSDRRSLILSRTKYSGEIVLSNRKIYMFTVRAKHGVSWSSPAFFVYVYVDIFEPQKIVEIKFVIKIN